MNKNKQTTYNFIIKDLTLIVEDYDGQTIESVLQGYYKQWSQEPGNNRASFTKFVYDYIFSYPMIPFDNYSIEDFLNSLELLSDDDTNDYIDLYIQLVSQVIYDLMQGKQSSYQ